MHTLQYTHSSVFRLSCRAKHWPRTLGVEVSLHWPSSYCFTPNDHQVARIFLVLIQPIRCALSKWPLRRWFCYIRQQTNRFCLRRCRKYWKMTEKNSQNIGRKSTQITVIDKCIICSADVSLRSLGARTRWNLQSTVPSAAALRETIKFCFYLFDGEVSQYLGAGKAAFVYGSCTCRLNRFDTTRRKYEAVKEDLEEQTREILALWQSYPQAQAQLQPRPQSARANRIVPWKTWLSQNRFGADWPRGFAGFGGKPYDLGQCLNPWFSALQRESNTTKTTLSFFRFFFQV